MKIIIFDGSFKTTAFIKRLCNGLVKEGHDVFVLGFNEADSYPVDGVVYVKLGSNQDKFSFFGTGLKWGWTSGLLFKQVLQLLKGRKQAVQQLNLTAALNKIEPDIVHVQWVSNIPIFETYLLNSNYKFILSQRGFQTNVRPFINSKNFEYLQKWLPKFCGFHSVSEAIAAKGDDIYAHQDKIDHVVYTGLDMNKFTFNEESPSNDHLQIISIGRAHWVKGYDIAIRAVKYLKDQQIDFHYSIVGAENDEELLFLINDLDLNDHVELLPKLPQPEVFERVSQADLFLLPSLEEGIANVAVEAMALGCPVISTNCGGMEELITHGKEGWIVPVYDIEGLAKQIIECSRLPQNEIVDVINCARAKVERQHNEEQMITGMLKLYHQVLE
jgi:colanic acid/amylovoran biosynthesis glycosyltransferase